MKFIKKFDTDTNYNKFVMGSDYIEPHTSTITDTGVGVSKVNYNYKIPDNVIMFGYKYIEGKDPLVDDYNTSTIKKDSNIKEIKYDNENGIGKIIFKDKVTTIGEFAFAICLNLTSIIILDSVTSIGDSAFNSCTSLASITIPSSVTAIGNIAFYSCTSLTSINYTGTLLQFKLISDKVLKDIKNNQGLTITCTDGKYDGNLNKI